MAGLKRRLDGYQKAWIGVWILIAVCVIIFASLVHSAIDAIIWLGQL